MQARYIKLLLWASALFVGWQLGRSDDVVNALFLFIAAGVVPGTDVVLAPDQVFLLLGGLLALAVLLIFGTNLRRTAWFLFARRPSGEIMEESGLAAPEVVSEAAATTKKGKKQKDNKAASPKLVAVTQLPKKPVRLVLLLRAASTSLLAGWVRMAAKLHRYFPRAVAGAAQALGSMRELTLPLWQHGMAFVQYGWRAARQVFIRSTIVVGRSVARLWDWLEPRLRLIDYWIGVQVRTTAGTIGRNESIRAAKRLGREAIRLVANLRAEARAVLMRVVEK